MRRPLAFVMSLVAFGAAVWLPSTIYGQVFPGNPVGGGGSGGSSPPFSDANTLVKGGTDPTKLLRFEVDGFTTGTTRVLTWPNVDATAAHIGTAAQTFAGRLLMSTSNGIYFGAEATTTNTIKVRTEQTPDTGMFTTGSTSNAWLIAETADEAFDFAHAATTNPTLFIHSTNQSTTEFGLLNYLGAASSRNTVTVDGATTFALTSGYIVLVCTGAETINTITGGTPGAVIHIENSDSECTIADDDDATAANAIDLTGAATTDVGAVAKVITLIYNGSHWLQTAESDN